MKSSGWRTAAQTLSLSVALTVGLSGCSDGCASGTDAPRPGDGNAAAESGEPHGPDRGPFPPRDGATPVVALGAVSLELNPEDPTLSATLWNVGTWESHQTQELLQRLRPGDTFVDVGANIGYYTVLAANAVGPEGRVFAFEPDPESFALLQRNVQRNGLQHVVLENKAAGEQNGSLRLFLSTANRGDHRVYDPGGGRTSIEVEVVVLDDYFAKIGGPVHFAKIDTRGAECAILAGMKSTFVQHPELALAVAYYPTFVEAMGYQPRQCFGALVEAGYTLDWVDEARGTVAKIDVDALPPAEDGALLLPRR